MRTLEEIKDAIIQNDYQCFRPSVKLISENYITDENQSVKWNKEEAKRIRELYDKELVKFKEDKKKRYIELNEECMEAIKENVNKKITTKQAELIWNMAKEIDDDESFVALFYWLEDLIDLINKII